MNCRFIFHFLISDSTASIVSEIKLISRRTIEVKNISSDRNIAIIQSIVVACETYTKYSVYHSNV